MIKKKVNIRVKGKTVETTILMPESLDEAAKMMSARDLMRAFEERAIYLAKLHLMREGRPPRERTKVTLNLKTLDPKTKELLAQLGVL